MIIHLSKWFSRGRLFFYIVVLISLLIFLLKYYPNVQLCYKILALITQVVGALFIVYSINSNIEIVKKTNLQAMFIDYLKDFPLIKIKREDATATPLGVARNSFVGEVKSIVTENSKSIEEEIEDLRKQIDDLKVNFTQKAIDLNERLVQQSEELNSQINQVNSERKELTAQIEEIFTGGNGIQIQVFGIFLMIYGAIVGFYS